MLPSHHQRRETLYAYITNHCIQWAARLLARSIANIIYSTAHPVIELHCCSLNHHTHNELHCCSLNHHHTNPPV